MSENKKKPDTEHDALATVVFVIFIALGALFITCAIGK